MTTLNAKTRRQLNARIVQNFHLVWLDASIDEVNDEHYSDSILHLQQLVNTVNTFTDIDECIDFITDMKEKLFMVMSRKFSQNILPTIHGISQISRIYIFSDNNMQDEKSTQEWSKVAGVHTNISSICEALKQHTQVCDHNSISISFIKKTDDAANQNLDTLDASFMYTQILKEILLTINFEQVHFDEFITYCRELFINNAAELKNIDRIEKEYRLHQPIWWYTYQYFLYSMLNRSLRLMEVDLITKMGFFVHDLHQHIAALHSEQYNEHHHSNSFIVYRGQGLSRSDFDQLQTTQGGLMSFNNFLSTSLDREVSFAFAECSQYDPDLIGVLFEIQVDPSISATPFANVQNASQFQGEEEVLFCMHSIFRIGQVKQMEKNNDRLWQVELTSTSDSDPELEKVTKSIRGETKGSTGWIRLGALMVRIAQYDKAQQVFQMTLNRTLCETEKDEIYIHIGLIKYNQGKNTEAITYFEKSLKIQQKILPANHPSLATYYNNIGSSYDSIGEYSKALCYYDKALEIKQKTLPSNHPDLATSYNNIGSTYHSMGDYPKALSYYEKALEISQKTLPANHPDLAISYNNIGNICDTMGDYPKALSYYKKALEIFQKTLPGNHHFLATSYNNIGGIYEHMGEYLEARAYFEKALEIEQKTLPANHPSLATCYNNIGSSYDSIGEYSKALCYYDKALEIKQKTLPSDHPDLATYYNNIGNTYNSMGDYPKAHSYFGKALEIKQKTLPANHPDLVISYNNIGSTYDSMGDYPKALSYLEKALEISQKTLPANHPHLASCYNSIAITYDHMGDYIKALMYHEKDLEISESIFPANHPHFATSYSNIGLVYCKMGDCSKGLSYLERALDIGQRSLPPNHQQINNVKKYIEVVRKICK